MEKETDMDVIFDDEKSEPEMVTAIELAGLRRDRQRLAELRAELQSLGLDVAEREASVIRRIDAGAQVDGAATVVQRRRQSISWLTVVARELGTGAVERVKNAWPTSFWKELQLS